MPRTLVFDLDGTLVDSLEDIRTPLVAALAEHGLPEPPVARVRDWIGEGARKLVERAVAWAKQGEDDALAGEIHRHFGLLYRSAPVVKTTAYEGMPEVLAQLKQRGHALAVLSNKPHDLTEIVVRSIFADGTFAAVAGARAGLPLKPDAAALTSIGLPLDGGAMIGDSAIDIATACNAGVTAIGVTWGLRPRAELEAAGAHHLAEKPSDLLDLLP
jgi:phosphoglycolate phosphatase